MYSWIVFCFMMLLTYSRGQSDDSPNVPERENSSSATSPSGERNRARSPLKDTSKEDMEDRGSTERLNHSRISITLGYDEWWFLTTSRPFISYKDFPGKPGVASWKEISSNSSTETRKSRKMNNPTAAEVTSSTGRFFPHMGYISLVWIALSQYSSLWT